MMNSSLHLEVTNRCTLECPACARTIWKDTVNRPIKKADLSFDKFTKFLDCKSGHNIKKLVLCGDYGDFIYYPDLFKLLNQFRNKNFELHTNGSRKSKDFWLQLADLMTDNDEIFFAIDGIGDENLQYRKNADWDSIMLGIDIMSKSKAKVKWQTIVFSFNENYLENIKSFANDKGAEFVPIRTHRYGEIKLMPKNTEFRDDKYNWSDDFNIAQPIALDPRCEFEKVITSDGYILPCDWIRHPHTFYKSDLWKNKEQWLNKLNIENINLDQGLKLVKEWKDLVLLKAATNGAMLDSICKMKCRSNCYSSNIINEIRDES